MGRTGSGVELRPNSIRLFFTFGGERIRETLTVNGKPIEPTPPNIKYANRVAGEIRRRIAQGTFVFADYFPDSKLAKDNEHPATFGALADDWLKTKGTLTEATKDQYGTAARFWKKLIGTDKLVADIDYKFLAKKIGEYPWSSAKTHNNYMIALRGIFELEYSGPRTLSNPMTGIKNMSVIKTLPDPMTPDERDKILADMKARYDERVYAYFLWAFYTGMRPEEMIALRWSDYDKKHQVIRVQRVRTYKGTERDGTKTNTVRDVDLLPQAVEALNIMRAHTFLKTTGEEGDNSADIFQNPGTGKPWHDERSQRDTYWRPCLKRLGIRWRKAYNTRHTFATVALMAGIPPAYIASQLGHSVKMLLEKYARWIPGADAGSARAMMAAALSNSSPEVPQAKQA